jgi:hypothetical protein
MAARLVRLCQTCHLPQANHCPGCNCCPGQECPYWCPGPDEPETDFGYVTRQMSQ